MAASEGQVVGRHERRPQVASRSGRAARAGMTLVGPANGTGSTEAVQVNGTRASRSRHAARGGLARWTGRARQAAEQARVWWAEGAERVSARARERWNEQAGAQRAAARQRPAASGHSNGAAFRTTSDGGSAERFRAADRDDTAARFGSANGTRAGRPTTPRHLVAEGRRASRREDLVTGWCSLLLVLGLYLDGWSHGERAGGGLTLWHG
ncbi:MAG TPA: hypothetical protein VH016_19115, partial [Actinomycetota bacterium]|nr:hypothetical protein [Actinomycetota bacterium]